MDALPRARHLRTLNSADNHMSEAFGRERLLPAVRACAPLRELLAGKLYNHHPSQNSPAVHEAQLLLLQRR